MKPEEIWKTALAQIEVKLDSPAQFQTWFRDTKLIEINGNKAVIGVRNSYASDWLKKKHNIMIKDTLSYVYGKEVDPEYEVVKEGVSETDEKQAPSDKAPILGVQEGIDTEFRETLKRSGLNEKYGFSNFIVGNSNKIAHAASLSIAEGNTTTYNPLFIWGSTGLGKTHLAQAIGRHILEKKPGKKVRYVTSEGFLNDMVKSIREGKGIEFRDRYRTTDVLIIDDIQLIHKWVETQSELFNTFNALINDNKQIVIVSDRLPEKIENIEPRLRSRFQGGLVVDILKPDFETRKAILLKKAQSLGIEMEDTTIEFIAKICEDNVRELEGSLQKISIYKSMSDHELTLEEIAKILGKDTKAKQEMVKIPNILKRVAKEYGLPVKDLKSADRTADVAFARQVAMYILREEFGYRLERVAEFLNRKDHTTIIHGVDKIKSKLMLEEGFKEQVNLMIEDLRNSEEI